jgi:hypothetical protein
MTIMPTRSTSSGSPWDFSSEDKIMAPQVDGVDLSESLSTKLKLVEINSLSALLNKIHDPVFVSCLGLDYFDVQEINKVFEGCGIATTLVPVFVPEAVEPLLLAPPSAKELVDTLALLTQASAILAQAIGASMPCPQNNSKGVPK